MKIYTHLSNECLIGCPGPEKTIVYRTCLMQEATVAIRQGRAGCESPFVLSITDVTYILNPILGVAHYLFDYDDKFVAAA